MAVKQELLLEMLSFFALAGMCPDRSTDTGMMRSSTVDVLMDPIPELFEVLTEEEDPMLRWTTYTYPAHLDLLYFKPQDAELEFGLEDTYSAATGEIFVSFICSFLPELLYFHHISEETNEADHPVRHNKHRLLSELSSAGMNCTVAYMSQCVSLKRCRDSCGSMGASRYRWFHQYGCCECIGSTCLDYGKGEPLCLKCPLPDNEEEYEDYYYYDSHEHDKYQGEMGDGEFDADGEVNLASDPS